MITIRRARDPYNEALYRLLSDSVCSVCAVCVLCEVYRLLRQCLQCMCCVGSICGGQRLLLDVFPHHSPPQCLRQGLLLCLERLTSKPPCFFCTSSPALGTTFSFLPGLWGLTSQAGTASIILTVISLHTFDIFFMQEQLWKITIQIIFNLIKIV